MGLANMVKQILGAYFDQVQHPLESFGSAIIWIEDVLVASRRRELEKQPQPMLFSCGAYVCKIEKIVLVHCQNIVESMKVGRLSRACPQIRDVDSAKLRGDLGTPIWRLPFRNTGNLYSRNRVEMSIIGIDLCT